MAQDATSRCWHCGTALSADLTVVIGRSRVLVGLGGQVTQHHLRHDYAVCRPVGIFVRHPQRHVWGLRNVRATHWRATIPGATWSRSPERAIAMVPERASTGGVTGRVESPAH